MSRGARPRAEMAQGRPDPGQGRPGTLPSSRTFERPWASTNFGIGGFETISPGQSQLTSGFIGDVDGTLHTRMLVTELRITLENWKPEDTTVGVQLNKLSESEIRN